jgi:translocation and assembly module TamB
VRRRLPLGVAALLVGGALLLLGLLGTAPGARWIAARAVAALPALSIERVEGSIIGGLRLAGLRWDDGRTAVRVERADAEIALAALLGGRIALDALAAEGVEVVLRDPPPDAPASADSGPARLPQITVERVSLARATLDLGGRRIAFDTARARLVLGDTRIALDGLALAGPDGRIDGQLAIDLARAVVVADADLRVDATLDGTRWSGTARLRPGAEADSVAIVLAAPLQATVDGRLGADGDRARLALRAPRQSGVALGLAGEIAADLEFALDAGRLVPRGTLSLDADTCAFEDGALQLAPDAITVDALRVASARHGALLLGGDAPRDAGGRWNLQLTTAGLMLPRDGATPLRLDGAIAVTGGAATPEIRPDLALAADGLPPGRLTGTLAWQGDALRFDALRFDVARGSLRLDGQLGFDATGVLEATLAGFDPALLLPEWPGVVDARLRYEGRLADAGPAGELLLQSLSGTLRGRALSGSASLRLADGGWREGALALTSGRARITGEARAADGTLAVRVEVPDLADLWPGATGALEADWRREGSDRIALRARSVTVEGVAVGSADAEARLGAGREGALSARVAASGLAVGGQALGALRLDVEGTRSAHVALLALDDGQRRADLRLDGAWREAAWRGRLDALSATAAGARLRLREGAALRFGAGEAALERACFETTGGSLCLAASHGPAGGSAEADLEGLSLAALRAWIGDERLPAMEGLARGSGRARWTAAGLAEAEARLESPRGLARLPKRPDLDLGYADLALDARWADGGGRIEGGARLVPEGRLDLAADLLPLEGGIGVDATLDVRITDLSGIEAFTTTIAEPEGELRGQLRLRGGALPESISGALALTGFTAQVPAQALRLREGVLVLAGVPGQLVLRGSMVSGDGTLTVDGRIDTGDPVPALLRIGGERVRVANTPNLSLLASPDLTLALRDGRWQLDGRLDIPRARIDASKLESGADRSPDVVVIDDPEPPDPARPWRARVRVSLGDDVKLTGFGFDGSLQGALDVTQRQGAQALASGEVTLQGRYAAYGQRLDIRRGGLRWANSPLGEPTLDLRAERKVRGETVALEVRGSAANPTSQVIAGAGTSDSEALSLLVTGRPLNRAGAADRERLSEASAALGAVGSELLTRSLGGRLGLDEIGVSNDTRLDGEAFTLGKYLSPRLFVGYGIGILTRGEVFTVRYLVTDRIEIEANAGATQRAAINWRIER